MKSVYLRFLGYLVAILLVSAVISILLVTISISVQSEPVLATTAPAQIPGPVGTLGKTAISSGQPALTPTTQTKHPELKGADLGVIIYCIALGFIGLFNMYNALEVYKKKEQINLELGELAMKYNESTDAIEIKQREVLCGYNEMDIDVKRSKIELEGRLTALQSELSKIAETHTQNLQKQISEIREGLNNRQQSIEEQMNLAKEDLEGYCKHLAQEHNKFYYTYCLYSLIPDYILNPKNRTRVYSATVWLSQNGDQEELELLRERQVKISCEDHDMLAVFSQAINELNTRLQTNG